MGKALITKLVLDNASYVALQSSYLLGTLYCFVTACLLSIITINGLFPSDPVMKVMIRNQVSGYQ